MGRGSGSSSSELSSSSGSSSEDTTLYFLGFFSFLTFFFGILRSSGSDDSYSLSIDSSFSSSTRAAFFSFFFFGAFVYGVNGEVGSEAPLLSNLTDLVVFFLSDASDMQGVPSSSTLFKVVCLPVVGTVTLASGRLMLS